MPGNRKSATAEELQASASRFREWMQARGLDPDRRAGQLAAAILLSVTEGEVSRWKAGKRVTPKPIVRLMELLKDPP
jgi:hypothetical protein